MLDADEPKKKKHQLAVLEIKTSRTSEETPEAMKQFLANLVNLKKTIIPRFWYFGVPVSLEITVIDQLIYFYVTVLEDYQGFIEAQLISQYPSALITKVQDYMPAIFEKEASLAVGQLRLAHGHLYPLRTSTEFKDIDPMSSLLGVLSKAQVGDSMSIQFLLLPIGSYWQKMGEKAAAGSTDSSGKTVSNPYAKDIMMKVAQAGFQTAIRVAVNSESKERSNALLTQIAHSFASYATPLNTLTLHKPFMWRKKKLARVMVQRSNAYMPRMQILNVAELSSMFHFPTMKLANIHNISWHKVILSDPPSNLTVAENLTEEEKVDVNFFARTEYKNKMTVFGIKRNDRRRHVYVIGKTGSGKSTLIANMAINDMRNKRGFAIIDPHGDLCEVLLDYVPSYRINDVIYMDPSQVDRAVAINPLEVMDEGQKELTVSGIVAIFNKLYGNSWGPRLEYILRNTLLSVVEMPDATLLMVPEMLGNEKFRAKVVDRLTDPVLKSFWLNEFNMYSDKMRTEAVSPIQNKVGQFLSSTVIRNILKNPKSTLDLRKIMDEGKILLLNLSQGKLGEDNAALLGAMIITKIQLAAMSRVNIPEPERRDFYLYVDEFQNFATNSFIKILSEARKYRLNLILANQYIAQIEEDVRAAIFGNAGTLMSFLVGATDAAYLAKEYKERFKEEDLLALGNYRAIVKLAIDNVTMPPFLCYSLPLPRSVTQSRDKVLRNSLERYTKPVKVEAPVIKQNPETKAPEIVKDTPAVTVPQPAQQPTPPVQTAPAQQKPEQKPEIMAESKPAQHHSSQPVSPSPEAVSSHEPKETKQPSPVAPAPSVENKPPVQHKPAQHPPKQQHQQKPHKHNPNQQHNGKKQGHQNQPSNQYPHVAKPANHTNQQVPTQAVKKVVQTQQQIQGRTETSAKAEK